MMQIGHHPSRLAGCAGTALAVAAMAALMAACSTPTHCDRGVSSEVTFVGTVEAVGADGQVSLLVESVESVTDLGTIPRAPVFGVTTPVGPSAILSGVVVGSAVTVQFPKTQVDHLKRDLKKRYRVVAIPSGTPERLAAELQDIDNPCGRAAFA